MLKEGWQQLLEEGLDKMAQMPTAELDQQTALFGVGERDVVVKNTQMLLTDTGIIADESDLGVSGGFLLVSPKRNSVTVHQFDSPEIKIAHYLLLVGHLAIGHVAPDEIKLKYSVSLVDDSPSEIVTEERGSKRWAKALLERAIQQPAGKANLVVTNLFRSLPYT